MRIERVFDITGLDGKYQNIKIAVEGEDALEVLSKLYQTLYTERALYANLAGQDYPLEEKLATVKNAVINLATLLNSNNQISTEGD